MTTTAIPSQAQQRRARFVAGHGARPIAMAQRLFPGISGDAIRRALETWHGVHPDQGAMEHQCAIHEAGHFVEAQAAGLGAYYADIRRPRLGRSDWTGKAISLRQPMHDGRTDFTAEDVEREARFAIAGPLSEQCLGGGDAFGSPGEILEACVLAGAAADMRGENRAAVLMRVWTRTAQNVFRFSDQIERVAGRLKSSAKGKGGVFNTSRGMVGILRQINEASHAETRLLTTDQSNALNHLFNSAPIELVRFTEEVGK